MSFCLIDYDCNGDLALFCNAFCFTQIESMKNFPTKVYQSFFVVMFFLLGFVSVVSVIYGVYCLIAV